MIVFIIYKPQYNGIFLKPENPGSLFVVIVEIKFIPDNISSS